MRWMMGGVYLVVLTMPVGQALGMPAQAHSPVVVEREPTAQHGNALLERLVTVRLRNVPLRRALAEIDRQAHLGLAYTSEIVPLERLVTVVRSNVTAEAALREVLRGTAVTVEVTRDGRVALVKAGRVDTVGTVRGRVTAAATGAPLVGAAVSVPGTSLSTVTGDSGLFAFEQVPQGEHTVVARFIGFLPLTKKVSVDTGAVRVDFALVARPARLDDLVATATGAQRRRDIGNAITTIKADSVMRTAPIRNLTDLLQDRVTGLTVQHTSGAPGDPARLRLRGLNSALRSNDPVVVVDGVRLYAAQAEVRSGNLTNGLLGAIPDGRLGKTPLPAPSPLDQIDPNIIEKIEVFKGPSAATLYGADAANGVIVITTKKGRPGPARWDVALNQGLTETPGTYPAGYYRWGHSIYNNATHFCTLLEATCVQDSLVRYQALNDPDLTVLGRGRRTAGSLTVSGGSSTLQYSLTGSYSDETGLLKLPAFEVDRYQALVGLPAPDWMRRPHHYMSWSASSRVTAQLGPTAEVALTTTLSRSEQSRTSLEHQVATLAGTYVDKVNGTYYTPGNFSLSTTSEFLQNFYQRTMASEVGFTTGLQSNWRPRPWFNGTAQAGLDVKPRQDELLLPVGPPGFGSDSGVLVRGVGRSLVSTLNLQGTVRKLLGAGFRFETNAGANLTTQRTDDMSSSAVGLVPGTGALSGATRFSATDASQNTSVFGYYIEPKIMGERLSLSTGIRLDGGSAYGARITRQSGGLFGLLALPKLNASWVISEEPWFPFKAIFSSLRLRGAYGQAQVQPGAADRLRLYKRAVGADPSYTLDRLGNTQLRPERDGELEGGFDADLLDSRLSLEVTGYRKTSRDALLPVALPSSLGGGSVLTNIGAIRNTGWEAKVNFTPLHGAAATWTVELGYSQNTNLLTELGTGVAPNPRTGLVAGYPVGGRWERPIVGYADRNGNGVLDGLSEIQVGDSAVYVGRLYPKSKTTLFSNLALFGGAVGVSAGFSYDAGATQVDQTAEFNWVLSRALIDPTASLGQQAAVLASRLPIVDGVSYSTDYGLIQQVSTFRFQSLSVNYRAPAAVARFVRARQLSIAVQGNNLGLHSTYRGKDPDVNSWAPGENIVDNGQLPQPRTWQLSVYANY